MKCIYSYKNNETGKADKSIFYERKNGCELVISDMRIEADVLDMRESQSVGIYKEHHSVRPLVGIGTFPTPLSPASVSLPLEPGGGGTLACWWGVGGVPIPTTGEKA